MQAYQQLDYVGDAVLRMIAYEFQPENPSEFPWHRNDKLAKIYDVIYEDRNPLDISKKHHDKRFLKKSKHGKASYVERFLGECYLEGGIAYAQAVFERMLRLLEMAK